MRPLSRGRRDDGRSDDDQRHRVVFDGSTHSRGFRLGGMVRYYSALPLTEIRVQRQVVATVPEKPSATLGQVTAVTTHVSGARAHFTTPPRRCRLTRRSP